MSNETEVTQDLPDGEAVVETSAPETAPQTDTEQPAEQEVEGDKPKRKPWWQSRIDELTREKYDARREAESYKTLADSLSRGEEGKAKPDADVDTLVRTRAAELVKAEQFNAKCNAVYSSGTSEFQDFDQTLANFQMLGGLPQPLLEAVTQLPDAHRVLHRLGNDMDEAARIMSLAPVPMAVELAKLSVSPKTAPVSNAPRPITPIDGSPKGEPDPDKMNYKEWEEWREAQLKQRR